MEFYQLNYYYYYYYYSELLLKIIFNGPDFLYRFLTFYKKKFKFSI